MDLGKVDPAGTAYCILYTAYCILSASQIIEKT
jgi:hypothetical protein